MPPVGFEPTISAGERPQTYALDRAATWTDIYLVISSFSQPNADNVTVCVITVIVNCTFIEPRLISSSRAYFGSSCAILRGFNFLVLCRFLYYSYARFS